MIIIGSSYEYVEYLAKSFTDTIHKIKALEKEGEEVSITRDQE
jgi:hypothetical protein